MIEYQHGGDIYTNSVELDYSANLNPLGLPDGVREAYLKAAGQCSVYPDGQCHALKEALAAFHETKGEAVICGNGAAELIFLLAFAVRPKRALLIAPSFLEYEQALKAVNCEISWFDLKEEEGFALSIPELIRHLKRLPAATAPPDILFLCNPNNPTGLGTKREQLYDLLEFCEIQGIILVLDECFNEFLNVPGQYSMMEEFRSGRYSCLFLLKAFTKIYAMAGLRLGYGLCADAALLDSMERCRQPWSVSGPAQAAGRAALYETAYVERTRRLIKRERQWLKGQLEQLGLFVYDSLANYLFFKEAVQTEGKGFLYGACLERGVLIRSCSNYRGLDSRYYRICVKDRKDNERLLKSFKMAAEAMPVG